MTPKEKVSSDKKIAIIVGVLFIIATVAGFLSVAFLGPVLADSDYLISFSTNKNQVIVGALLDLIGAAAFVIIAIVIFPILKNIMRKSRWGMLSPAVLMRSPLLLGISAY